MKVLEWVASYLRFRCHLVGQIEEELLPVIHDLVAELPRHMALRDDNLG